MNHIYTVSELTGKIKKLLEEKYPFVWITGEISNFSIPGSGHAYFSLKDTGSLINCVMFRNQRKRLKFIPENGMKITGMGRISLYEPRGSYQIIFEHIEPEGAGALQIAFEQLKRKLSQEGLFDDALKKPIPFLPSKISVITSGTGAAVRDIIIVGKRRFPGIYFEIVPVKVQGKEAEYEIANAFEIVNSIDNSDLIILGRGGGSLEDLAPFNSEIVARAVHSSNIPVISAVGHETDFTIADFVADLRAPTPSAAAELAIPDKFVLENKIKMFEAGLVKEIKHYLYSLRTRIYDLTRRIIRPDRIVDDMRFRLEDFEIRMEISIKKIFAVHQERLEWLTKSLYLKNPEKDIIILKENTDKLISRLKISIYGVIHQYRSQYERVFSGFKALSPMAVLKRGYSIVKKYPGQVVLTDSAMIEKNNLVEVILAKGRLLCQVKDKEGIREKNFKEENG